MIAVFTKYDQLRRETSFRLEDQGLNTSADAVLLNAEVEKIFKEQYLAKLLGSAPAVRFGSENFINQLYVLCCFLSRRNAQARSKVS